MNADFLERPEYSRKALTTPTVRKLLAFVSVCGIAASIFIYIYSYSGAPADKLFPWALLLLVGVLVVYVPILTIEYSRSGTGVSVQKRIEQGMPRWFKSCSIFLMLLCVGHFVWFGVHSGMGVPEIMDGQYVIDARGHILKVLTRSEYLALKQAELRMFATLMITFYFMPMMYWWFRKDQQQTA